MFAAIRPDRTFSIGDVASQYGLSKHHVAKVINRLVQTGYLQARRGRRGGVWLGCDPKDIQIGSLVRLTESSSPLVECFSDKSNLCRLTPACRLKSALAKALDAFYACLDQHTLADLVDNRVALAELLETRQ